MQETSKLNYSSNDYYRSMIQCIPDTAFTLFTWAATDTENNTDIKNPNNDSEEIFIKLMDKNVKEVTFSYGNSGNCLIRIFDLLGNLIESDNLNYAFGTNTYKLQNQYRTNGIYFIIVINDKNELLKYSFIQ